VDTESLKAFVSVATTQSFSSAAEQLHLTQPAISKRIAALEKRLGKQLFDRLGREVVLTEAGEVLLPRANQLLRLLADAERDIRELSGEIAGTLRVATSHHIGLHHLPPILREFAVRHSQVQLQFEFLDSEQAYERVARGDCELAVVTTAPETRPPLQRTLLWQDTLAFVVSDNHPLNAVAGPSLQTLAEYPAILPDLNTHTGRIVKHCFDDAGFPLELSMKTNYLETIKVMVSVGLGWSVLPLSMIDNSLRKIDIPGIELSRDLGIVTHTRRTLSNAAAAFLKTLVATSDGVNQRANEN